MVLNKEIQCFQNKLDLLLRHEMLIILLNDIRRVCIFLKQELVLKFKKDIFKKSSFLAIFLCNYINQLLLFS